MGLFDEFESAPTQPRQAKKRSGLFDEFDEGRYSAAIEPAQTKPLTPNEQYEADGGGVAKSIEKGFTALTTLMAPAAAMQNKQAAAIAALMGDKQAMAIANDAALPLRAVEAGVKHYNTLPKNPIGGNVAQAYEAESGINAPVAAVKEFAAHPKLAVDYLAEMLPAAVPGGLAGGTAAKLTADQLLKRAIIPNVVSRIAPKAAAGAGANAGATLSGGMVPNAAGIYEKNGGNLGDALRTGGKQTLVESAVAAPFGAVLPFGNRVLPTAAKALVVSPIDEIAQTVAGNSAIGEKTSGGEMMAASLLGATSSPADIATAIVASKQGEQDQAVPAPAPTQAAQPKPETAKKPGMFDDIERQAADSTVDPFIPQQQPRAVVETAQPMPQVFRSGRLGDAVANPRAVVETPTPHAVIETPGPRAIIETPVPRGIVETAQPQYADPPAPVDTPMMTLPTEEAQPEQSAHEADAGLRDLTEGLIRQMRDAKQIDLDRSLRTAIDRIKAGGVNEKPAYFAKLAKEFEKRGDSKTSGILGQVATTLKARQKAIPKPAAPKQPKVTKTGAQTADEFSESSRKEFLRMVKQMGGISTEFAADITGEPANQANRILPGFFSTRGNNLDLVARRLHEAGYISDQEYNDVDGGVERTRELLGQALSKEFVGTPDQQQTLAEMEAREADAAAELQSAAEQAMLAEIVGDDLTAAEFAALHDGIPQDDAADSADAYRAAQQEQDDGQSAETERKAGEVQPGRAEANSQGSEGQPGRAAIQGADAGQEARPDLSLAQQTERDLAERERELNRREAEQNARERAALDKEKADRARDDFTLTGSDRASDANAGQGDLLSAPNEEARNDSPVAESQSPDTGSGDAGVAPGRAAVSPQQKDATTPSAHESLFERVNAGEVTAAEFKASFDALLKNKEAIVAELSGMTKDALFKRFPGLVYRYKNEKKADVVEAAFRDMVDDFTLGAGYSYGMSSGSRTESIRAIVDRTTDATLADHAEAIKKARAERAEARKQVEAGLEDPQTLDDFQRLMAERAREIGGVVTYKQVRMTLTPEQRERFDVLAAEKSRGERSRNKEAQQERSIRAPGETVETTDIIKTRHTKHGHDLWQFNLVERVSGEEFKSLVGQAKRLGGDYSSYRGNGAIPGWQFRTEEAAIAFKALVAGDTTQARDVMQTRRDAYADDRSQTAVERLTEMADSLEAKADASLNQERKANTDRRARQVASAEASANSDKAMAQTMRNIAGAIERGTAKMLDRIRQKVQVETLYGFVNTAQSDKLRALYPSYADYERHQGEKPNAETADYVTFPEYTAYRSDLASLGRALLETEGTKKLGQQIMKVADDVSDAYLKFAKENLHKVSTFSTKDGGRAAFPSKATAEAAIHRSGYKGAAIVLPFKRNENLIILSPSEAIKRGVWEGDNDKRITLKAEFGAELVEKIGKAARRGEKMSVPWQFESAYDKRKRLAGMGIETPAELRAAVREFIALREAPKEADKIKAMERAMIGRRNDGMDFFPTPAGVADEMVEAAGIEDGMSVLEPSAGMGHIAERIRAAGVEPDVVELSNERKELLEAKGFRVVGRDFMDVSEGQYDRILMNPPFGDRRDAAHVQHAYELLKPGGRLVSIMGEGVFFGSDKKAQAFRDWLEQRGATDEKLEEGTFLDPSLPVNTGTNARMVVIDKPGPAFQPPKETDSGIALFRRTEPAGDSGSVSQVELDAVILRVASGWKRAQGDSGRLLVVDSPSDLPGAILRAANAQNVPKEEIKGVFHNGHIYLVRENHASANDAEETIFHEAYGHMGALLLNGNDQKKLSAAFNDVWHRIDGLDGVRKMADKFGVLDQVEPYIKSLAAADMTLETKRRIIVDELLAHIAGRGDFTLKEQAKAYIGALRVGLRNAARAMKLDGIAQALDGYTDMELLWNLKQMRAAVVSGKTGKGGGTLFARRVPSGPNSPQQPLKLGNASGFDIDPETRAEAIQRKHQDKMNRWAKVQRQIKEQGGTVELDQDVYHAMERMTGRAADRIDSFTHETVRPLLKRVADLKTNLEEVGTYLMALGAKDRNAYIRTIRQDMPGNGSGMSDAEAAQIVADYKTRPDFAEFDALARDFQKLTERKLKVLVGGGVIDQQHADNLTQSFGFYVPYKGFETIDEDGNRTGGIGSGYSTPKRFSKQAFGRVSKAGQVVENIIRDYEQAVILAEKANVGRYVRNLANANPDATLWTVDQPPSQPVMKGGIVSLMQKGFDNQDEIRFIENGREVRIQLHDKLLAETYNNLGDEPMTFIMKAGDTVNRFLRQTYTQKNPAFILVNAVRDIQTGLAVMTGEMGMKNAIKALRHAPGAWKAASRESLNRGSVTGEWAQYMDAYRKTGAQTAYYAVGDIEAKQAKLEELLAREGGQTFINQWKQHGGGLKGAKATAQLAAWRTYNNAVVDVIESLNGGFENMMRLAAFRQYIDDHGGLASASKETLAEASRIAKNLTVNFNRKGEKTRGMNALYLFWNANVQGTNNLYRAATKTLHSKEVKAIYGGMVGLGFMMSLATGDEEDDLTPGYTKGTSIVVHLGNGKRVQIPLAYGLGYFVALGYEIGNLLQDRETPVHAAMNIVGQALTHFSPFGNPIHDGKMDSRDVIIAATPTVLKPAVMSGMNRNQLGYEVVPKYGDDTPDRTAMRANTRGGTYDAAAGGLEWLGADVSPETLKMLTTFIAGGLGTFISDTGTAGMVASKGGFDPEKTPILKRFYGENDVEEHRARFYGLAEDVQGQAREQGKKQNEFFGGNKDADSVQDFKRQMKTLREKESAAHEKGNERVVEAAQKQQIRLADAFKKEHDRMVKRGLIERR